MDRGRRAGVIVGAIAVGVATIVSIVFGVVGIGATVSAGGQAQVCGGITVGVTVSEGRVRLPGMSGDWFGPGERQHLHPLCVVEVVSIEETESDPDDDGGGARVQLRWRLG